METREKVMKCPTTDERYAVRMTGQYVVEKRSFLSTQKFLLKIPSFAKMVGDLSDLRIRIESFNT
jgi:hypothetical protein